MSVTSTPERWYMLWNLSLAVIVLLVVGLMLWWLGPFIIARGLELRDRRLK